MLDARRDFVWPEARLVVELDSWTWHRGRARFKDDRARDQALVAAGWRVVRFTTRQLAQDPAHIATTLLALLAP